ncbi:uncharacterized protein LOC133409452 [Phycodurus eques]|uniref:uncharacterized protein LOC133409452 n=1 Tax=Phycodurus eques TaxID=693459 RepID=UPI002ACDBE8B|nr:uncharacterized protein LOC133409452 [Phycodurus eques]
MDTPTSRSANRTKAESHAQGPDLTLAHVHTRTLEMAKVAEIVGDKVGDMVEGILKRALGAKDTDKDKDKGGFGSFFGGDKKKDDDDDDDDKGSFFSKIFDRDDDDKKAKASGFDGLFSELDSPGGGAGGGPGGTGGGAGGSGGGAGGTGDLFGDLLEVAEEASEGK